MCLSACLPGPSLDVHRVNNVQHFAPQICVHPFTIHSKLYCDCSQLYCGCSPTGWPARGVQDVHGPVQCEGWRGTVHHWTQLSQKQQGDLPGASGRTHCLAGGGDAGQGTLPLGQCPLYSHCPHVLSYVALCLLRQAARSSSLSVPSWTFVDRILAWRGICNIFHFQVW